MMRAVGAGQTQRAEVRAQAVHEFFAAWYESLRAPDRRRPSAGVTELPDSALWILHRLRYLGPMSASDLARSFGLDRSTISRQLEPLRDGRLVVESLDRSDRRVSIISVSARGRRLLERVADSQVHYWDRVLGHLSTSEQDQLIRMLNRLSEAIDSESVD